MKKPKLTTITIGGHTYSGYIIDDIFYHVGGTIGYNINKSTTFRTSDEMEEYILKLSNAK